MKKNEATGIFGQCGVSDTSRDCAEKKELVTISLTGRGEAVLKIAVMPLDG